MALRRGADERLAADSRDQLQAYFRIDLCGIEYVFRENSTRDAPVLIPGSKSVGTDLELEELVGTD